MKSLEKYVAIIAGRERNLTLCIGNASEVTDSQCTVKREGRPDLLDVQLNAFETVTDFCTVVPKEGSLVLVALPPEEATAAYVVSCSEVEKVIWKNGNSALLFDAKGWGIKRGDETLLKILSDLLKAILKLTVTTSSGPSGTPINAKDFTDIATRLTKLLQ